MKLHFNGLSTKQLLRKVCSFRRGAVKIPGLWLNIKMVPEVTNSTEIKPWWKKKVCVCLSWNINKYHTSTNESSTRPKKGKAPTQHFQGEVQESALRVLSVHLKLLDVPVGSIIQILLLQFECKPSVKRRYNCYFCKFIIDLTLD